MNSPKNASKVTIKIPRPLYEKILTMIEDRGFSSVTDFVVYVLRDLVASHFLALSDEQQEPGGKKNQMEKVKARLRALGDLAANEKTWHEQENSGE